MGRKQKRVRQFRKTIGELLTEARAAGRPVDGTVCVDMETEAPVGVYKPSKSGRFRRVAQTQYRTVIEGE